jgi:hypothetical protein
MPSFTPDDLNIDVDDFYCECNKYEIQQLIKYLIEDGHISEDQLEIDEKLSLAEWEFTKTITKIADNLYDLLIVLI